MIFKRSVLFLILSLVIGTGYALRCGNQLIDVGDPEIKVLSACGKPTLEKQINKQVTVDPNNAQPNAEISFITQYTYNFGPNQFIYIITIKNGKVIKIETNGYGFTPTN